MWGFLQRGETCPGHARGHRNQSPGSPPPPASAQVQRWQPSVTRQASRMSLRDCRTTVSQ